MDKEHVPLKMYVHNTVWGILAITFSSLGIFFSLLVVMFFLFKFEHPVVSGNSTYSFNQKDFARSHVFH